MSFNIKDTRYFLHYSTIKDILLFTDLDILQLEEGFTNIKKLGYRDWTWVGTKIIESLFKRVVWDLHNLPTSFVYVERGEVNKNNIEDDFSYFILKLEKIEGKEFINLYESREYSVEKKELEGDILYKDFSSKGFLESGFNLTYTILPKGYLISKLKGKSKEDSYVKNYKVYLHRDDLSQYEEMSEKEREVCTSSLYRKEWTDYVDSLSLEYSFLTKTSLYKFIKSFMSFWYKEVKNKGIRFVEPNSNFNLNISLEDFYTREADKWQRNRLLKEETQELQLLLSTIKNTAHLRNNIKQKVKDKIKTRKKNIKSTFPYLLLS